MAYYKFDHYEINGEAVYSNPVTISVDSDLIVQAVYVEDNTPQCPTGYHWDSVANACVPDQVPVPDQDGQDNSAELIVIVLVAAAILLL